MTDGPLTRQPIWFPYAQMRTARVPYRVVRAHGTRLVLDDGRELIDGVASWWCAIHGYAHPQIDAAAREQLGQMAHVMLGGLTHTPAERLAARLVELTPTGLDHVFFGDSGSVGVEIALKMALQYWFNQGHRDKHRFLALEKAYHGDTTGCMSVGDPAEGMHRRFAGLVPRQVFAPAPRGGFDDDPAAVDTSIDALRACIVTHHHELAAVIMEPILQAAGGFNLMSPRYLAAARELCHDHDVLLILDEVATGFGRTGRLFAAEHADITPDILVLGKALTAGYLGHSATLATGQVYDAFLSDDLGDAFMHGPTFMGNPLACAIALAGIDVFQRDDYLGKIARIEAILQEELGSLRHPAIKDVRILAATGAIHVHDPAVLKGARAFAAERGAWLRSFDNYLYTMPAYIIADDDLRHLCTIMRDWFAR